MRFPTIATALALLASGAQAEEPGIRAMAVQRCRDWQPSVAQLQLLRHGNMTVERGRELCVEGLERQLARDAEAEGTREAERRRAAEGQAAQ
jgi:hypothetical protein